jgi:Ca2+-dependent lipid-binding protein
MEALGGTLTMSILDGLLLRDTEMIGKMDPFIEIVYKGKKYKTTTIQEGGKNPVWNQILEIPIESLSDELTIFCYDEDSVVHDVVGECKYPVNYFAHQ